MILGKLFNPKKKNLGSLRRTLIQFFGGSLVPIDDNFESYIHEGFENNPLVWDCVDFISSRAATIPLQLCREGPEGEEVINDHPILKLLRNPNTTQTARELREQFFAQYLITGNGYHGLMRRGQAGNGQVFRIHNLPPTYVRINADSQRPDIVSGYSMVNVFKAEFKPEDVIHMKKANLDYDAAQWLYGQSPLKAGRRALNLSNSIYDALASQARNQGVKGLLTANNELGEMMGADELRNLKAEVEQQINGKDKRGKIAATTAGFNFLQLGQHSRDMQLVEGYEAARKEICTLFHLPVQIFNDTSASTYNNMKEAKKAAYADAIVPLVRAYCEKLTKGLLQDGEYFRPDLSGIDELKQDRAAQIESLEKAYWIPTSEKQRILEVEQDGTLDEYYIPANLMPVGLESEEVDQMAEEGAKFGDYQMKKTFSNYPQSATNNAKRALKHKEENGSSCGTRVGWERANQIASREALSLDTIKRTFSFLSRSETYYTEGGSLDECGNIMYLAWGGKSMKRWCESTLDSEDGKWLSEEVEFQKSLNG